MTVQTVGAKPISVTIDTTYHHYNGPLTIKNCLITDPGVIAVIRPLIVQLGPALNYTLLPHACHIVHMLGYCGHSSFVGRFLCWKVYAIL